MMEIQTLQKKTKKDANAEKEKEKEKDKEKEKEKPKETTTTATGAKTGITDDDMEDLWGGSDDDKGDGMNNEKSSNEQPRDENGLICTTFSAEVHGGDKKCATCLVAFVEKEEIKVLPRCKCPYHPKCIDEWIKTRKTTHNSEPVECPEHHTPILEE